MTNIYLLLEAARKSLLYDYREREAQFIGKMPFELIKTAYGECETVSDVINLTEGFLELKDLVDKTFSGRR